MCFEAIGRILSHVLAVRTMELGNGLFHSYDLVFRVRLSVATCRNRILVANAEAILILTSIGGERSLIS